MRLLAHRVSANDSQIHDARAGDRALRLQNYSQGVLLRGLSFHLDKRGRAHNRPLLASLFSRERIGRHELRLDTLLTRKPVGLESAADIYKVPVSSLVSCNGSSRFYLRSSFSAAPRGLVIILSSSRTSRSEKSSVTKSHPNRAPI